MNRARLYRHPDGEGDIYFEPDTCRLYMGHEAEALCAYAVIGPRGLREVAAQMVELANSMEAKQ